MKIILTQEVSGLGTPGDVIEVKNGYGRNYLLPQGFAIQWSKGAEKQVTVIKRARDAREIRDLGQANEVKGQLEGLKVTLQARSGTGGRLFGSITPAEIVDAVKSAGGPLAAVGYTVVWYGVPVVLFVLYMLVLNGTQQAHALDTLAGAAPQFGLSLVLSMLVAVGLRWASGSWKAASVGLAAAVMGGGLATVLTSAITGQSLS